MSDYDSSSHYGTSDDDDNQVVRTRVQARARFTSYETPHDIPFGSRLTHLAVQNRVFVVCAAPNGSTTSSGELYIRDDSADSFRRVPLTCPVHRLFLDMTGTHVFISSPTSDLFYVSTAIQGMKVARVVQGGAGVPTIDTLAFTTTLASPTQLNAVGMTCTAAALPEDAGATPRPLLNALHQSLHKKGNAKAGYPPALAVNSPGVVLYGTRAGVLNAVQVLVDATTKTAFSATLLPPMVCNRFPSAASALLSGGAGATSAADTKMIDASSKFLAKSSPITGLEVMNWAGPGGATAIRVLVSTSNALFSFFGADLLGAVANGTPLRLHDLPSNVTGSSMAIAVGGSAEDAAFTRGNASALNIFRSFATSPPQSFTWTAPSHVVHGSFDAMGRVTSLQPLPFPFYTAKQSGTAGVGGRPAYERAPYEVVGTAFHMLCRYENRIIALKAPPGLVWKPKIDPREGRSWARNDHNGGGSGGHNDSTSDRANESTAAETSGLATIERFSDFDWLDRACYEFQRRDGKFLGIVRDTQARLIYFFNDRTIQQLEIAKESVGPLWSYFFDRAIDGTPTRAAMAAMLATPGSSSMNNTTTGISGGGASSVHHYHSHHVTTTTAGGDANLPQGLQRAAWIDLRLRWFTAASHLAPPKSRELDRVLFEMGRFLVDQVLGAAATAPAAGGASSAVGMDPTSPHLLAASGAGTTAADVTAKYRAMALDALVRCNCFEEVVLLLRKSNLLGDYVERRLRLLVEEVEAEQDLQQEDPAAAKKKRDAGVDTTKQQQIAMLNTFATLLRLEPATSAASNSTASASFDSRSQKKSPTIAPDVARLIDFQCEHACIGRLLEDDPYFQVLSRLFGALGSSHAAVTLAKKTGRYRSALAHFVQLRRYKEASDILAGDCINVINAAVKGTGKGNAQMKIDDMVHVWYEFSGQVVVHQPTSIFTAWTKMARLVPQNLIDFRRFIPALISYDMHATKACVSSASASAAVDREENDLLDFSTQPPGLETINLLQVLANQSSGAMMSRVMNDLLFSTMLTLLQQHNPSLRRQLESHQNKLAGLQAAERARREREAKRAGGATDGATAGAGSAAAAQQPSALDAAMTKASLAAQKLLIPESARLDEDTLERYMDITSTFLEGAPDITLEFALRRCVEAGFLDYCFFLYSQLGMHQEAVLAALHAPLYCTQGMLLPDKKPYSQLVADADALARQPGGATRAMEMKARATMESLKDGIDAAVAYLRRIREDAMYGPSTPSSHASQRIVGETELKHLWVAFAKAAITTGAKAAAAKAGALDNVTDHGNALDPKILLELIRASDGLLTLEDILADLGSFEVLRDFKEAVCSNLERYARMMTDITHETQRTTELAERLKADVQGAAHQYGVVNAAQRCGVCKKTLLRKAGMAEPFVVFPTCRHAMHERCGEQLMQDETFRTKVWQQLLRMSAVEVPDSVFAAAAAASASGPSQGQMQQHMLQNGNSSRRGSPARGAAGSTAVASPTGNFTFASIPTPLPHSLLDLECPLCGECAIQNITEPLGAVVSI